MPSYPSCPSVDLLQSLHRGDLSGDGYAAIVQHVSSCMICESILSRIRQSDLFRLSGGESVSRSLAPKSPLAEEGAIPAAVAEQVPNRFSTMEHHYASQKSYDLAVMGVNSLIGRYRLKGILGQGGMGIVYDAVHVRLNRRVAVKVILPEYADNPRVIARFHREIRAIGELAHPNIVTATDADEVDGQHFLVMEFVEGHDLLRLLRQSGPFSVADACEVVRQTAAGLQYILERGRVHRDLKPSNMMLTFDGTIKIMDLGLAVLRNDVQQNSELTGPQQMMGTADFMAPEQWLDCHQVDIRADIYSLGCTMYQLLHGRPPFAGSQYNLPPRKQLAHAEAPRPSIRELRPDVPAPVDELLQRMMAIRPVDRFAEPRLIVEALAEFTQGADLCRLSAACRQPVGELALPHPGGLSGETATFQKQTFDDFPPPSDVISPVSTASPKRRRRGTAIAASVVIGGILAAGISLGNRGETPPTTVAPATPATPVTIVATPPTLPEPKPVAGEWFPLLRREPEKLVWRNYKRDHTLTFTAEQSKVSVDAPYMALLSLGVTDHIGYRIQLGIRQTTWVGGVGLFFGLHDESREGKPVLVGQLLELRKTNDPNREKAFVLERSRVVFNADAGLQMDLIDSLGVASAFLSHPTNREEVILQIEVKPEGLTTVVWDGKPLPSLVKPTVNAGFGRHEYIGRFGTFHRQSHSVFGNAMFMSYEVPLR